jgi:hypothetical protein
MSDEFGKRTIFSPPFAVPDLTIAPIEFEPSFNESVCVDALPSDEELRKLVYGSIAVSPLNPNSQVNPELASMIADNYQFATVN